MEEHNPTKMSEPHIYLKSYFYNVFNSIILCQASQNSLDVIQKASYIAVLKSTLNKQKGFETLAV